MVQANRPEVNINKTMEENMLYLLNNIHRLKVKINVIKLVERENEI